MSHLKEREEKNCLNCGTQVLGRYCHVCGQENLEPRETFWHLVTHFVYDVTHFDGKFFATVKYLMVKPGFLPHEYIKGKRNTYLNPIRMYVFVSAIFFLFFLSVFKPDNVLKINDSGPKTAAQILKTLDREKKEAQDDLSKEKSPVEIALFKTKIDRLNGYIAEIEKDSANKEEVLRKFRSDLSVNENNYQSIEQYDSVQNKLPETKRDGWMQRAFMHRTIEVSHQYSENEKELWERLSEKFQHSFPQIMFVSLPLFALILKLLYIRRKQLYYVDHLVYGIHLYCAIFVFFFILLILDKIAGAHYFGWVKYASYIVWLYIVFYSYKSLRKFYLQGRVKTIFKWLLLNFSAFIMMALLFVIFALVSFFTF